MAKKRKVVISITGVAVVAAAILILRWTRHEPQRYAVAPFSATGAVVRDDADPRKQAPIADAKISVSTRLNAVTGVSGASGLFNVALRPGVFPGQTVTLRVEHPGYLPYEVQTWPRDELFIVHLTPAPQTPSEKVLEHLSPDAKPVAIKNVTVRYSVQAQATVDVGSLARQFEVTNIGNTPCDHHAPCSPDGQWKATVGTLSLDAEPGNVFRNVRVSCVGGPCPFTQVKSDLSTESQKKTISVLNWSDTASFLVEAEVIHLMVTDATRNFYPFVVGSTLTFALPTSAEGLCIEADVNGQQIVFPLGPDLILAWAACSVEPASDHNRTYRCTLKPGYQFVK